MTHNIQCIKINYTKIISLFLNIKIIYTTSYNKRTDPENNVTIIESIWVLLNLERVLFIWSSFFYAQWKLSTKPPLTCESNGTFKWKTVEVTVSSEHSISLQSETKCDISAVWSQKSRRLLRFNRNNVVTFLISWFQKEIFPYPPKKNKY